MFSAFGTEEFVDILARTFTEKGGFPFLVKSIAVVLE